MTLNKNRGIQGDIDTNILSQSTDGDEDGVNSIRSNFILVGSVVGVAALIALVFLFVTIKRRRNENRLFFTKAFQEIQLNINDEDDDDGDDLSQFNPSTINTEKTSVWKKRMESVLLNEEYEGNVSVVYPQSVFNQSTIVSEGTWVRRTAVPTLNKQSSVMDIDFFDDKPIPAHVMCYESKRKNEVEKEVVNESETDVDTDVVKDIVMEVVKDAKTEVETHVLEHI